MKIKPEYPKVCAVNHVSIAELMVMGESAKPAKVGGLTAQPLKEIETAGHAFETPIGYTAPGLFKNGTLIATCAFFHDGVENFRQHLSAELPSAARRWIGEKILGEEPGQCSITLINIPEDGSDWSSQDAAFLGRLGLGVSDPRTIDDDVF